MCGRLANRAAASSYFATLHTSCELSGLPFACLTSIADVVTMASLSVVGDCLSSVCLKSIALSRTRIVVRQVESYEQAEEVGFHAAQRPS